MKKQIFCCFLLLLSLFNVSFSMELRPTVDVYKIDPVIGECGRKKAFKIIHTNSLCASEEAKNVIEAILEGGQIGGYSGVLFHGPRGTGKTRMVREMARMVGGGALLRAQELMLTNYSRDELAQKLQDEAFQRRLGGYNRHLQQFLQKNFEEPVRNNEHDAYILDEVDVISGYDTKYNNGISPATMILNCLKMVHEVNKKRDTPVCVFATTNRPGDIPKKIRDSFLNVKIENPNFARRVMYFREFIDSMSRRGVDVSECNEEVLKRIAESSQNIAVRQLEVVKRDIEFLVCSQDGDQLSLKEEHFEKALETLYSDLDGRIIHFREFIDSMSCNGVDVSECNNEEVIKRIAKRSQKIIVCQLERDLEGVKKHVEARVFSRYGFRLSLKEEYFIEAIEKCCSQISDGLQSLNRPQLLNRSQPWYKKFSNWVQGIRLRRLVENNTAYSVRTLFARVFACFAMKRIIDCCRSLPRPSNVFFLSGRNNSLLQNQDTLHRQIHDRDDLFLLPPPARVVTPPERSDRALVASRNAPVRRSAFESDDFSTNALVFFDQYY